MLAPIGNGKHSNLYAHRIKWKGNQPEKKNSVMGFESKKSTVNLMHYNDDFSFFRNLVSLTNHFYMFLLLSKITIHKINKQIK